MRSLALLVVGASWLALTGLVPAQQSVARETVEPWVPETYKARVFFRIDADRTERHRQFNDMVRRLQTAAGFKKDKGLEKEEFFADTMSGTVPGKNAARMNADPRVQTAVLIPDGMEIPAEADKPIFVRIHLVDAFGTQRQHEIAEKTRKLLIEAKFQEAVGNDHQGHQRLQGWLPASQLDAILNQKLRIDLAAPPRAGESVPPTVRINPVQRIEVLREPVGAEPPKPASAPPAAGKPHLEKVSADLRKFIAGLPGDEANKPLRVEVVLRNLPGGEEDNWHDDLASVGMQIDGRSGHVVFGQAPASAVDAAAALPGVSTVRLPQPARAVTPGTFDPSKPVLDVDFIALRRSASVPGPLAKLIRRHEPMRVAIVGTDFRGFESLVGAQLPRNTTLLDFTGERSAEIRPEPMPGDAKELGFGARLALVFQATTAADEMLLVRVDPGSPYAVEEVLRCVNGGRWNSEAIARRDLEIRHEKSRLDELRLDVRVQRQLALNNFADDKDSIAAREKYRQNQKALDEIERVFNEKVDRYTAFRKATTRLKGVSNVLIGLHWSDGHSQLAADRQGLRFLDPALLERVAVIQALPRSPGQTWSGLFRDVDDDGVMEFVAAQHDAAARAGLNLLAWQPRQAGGAGSLVADLPAKAVVQLTLQWREVHASAWKSKAGEDVYRKPLAPLRIVILRQRDPQGKELPTDAFDVVERSSGLADRIENDSRAAVYEITLRFQVGDQPGRFAVLIQGVQPESTLPEEAARVPGAERWELHPRLQVQVVDPASRAAGQVVLRQSTRE